ncbi:MAG TPA: methyltransferase domain-containing protein [Euzebyales bacterium]|nr:methyltransferase domain-containing protein [Euzebyales bacterium]
MGYQRSYVLAGDNHFSSLAQEQRARLQRRHRHGPDIEAALLAAVAQRHPGRLLQIGSGSGRLAARISRHIAGRVVAIDVNAALTADAHARGVLAVVAQVRALPFAAGAMDGVVADRALRHERDVAEGLGEICRVLRPDGTLLAVVRSNARDGHELEVALGIAARRHTDALSTENGEAVLRRWFRHVEHQSLDYVLAFPDGRAAARYLATLPGRADMARHIATMKGSITLTYGVSLLVATAPLPR